MNYAPLTETQVHERVAQVMSNQHRIEDFMRSGVTACEPNRFDFEDGTRIVMMLIRANSRDNDMFKPGYIAAALDFWLPEVAELREAFTRAHTDIESGEPDLWACSNTIRRRVVQLVRPMGITIGSTLKRGLAGNHRAPYAALEIKEEGGR